MGSWQQLGRAMVSFRVHCLEAQIEQTALLQPGLLLGHLSFMGLQASAMVRKACREIEGRRKPRCFPRGARKISICIDASHVSSPLSRRARSVVPFRRGHGLTARTVNTAQGSTIVQTVRQAGGGVRLLRPERNGVQRGSCELGPCNCKRLPELRFPVRKRSC